MESKRRFLFLIAVCALGVGGCRTIEDRLATAGSPQAVAQAVADYYVQDAEDESCAVAIVSPQGTAFAHAGSATERSLFRIASLSKFFLHPVLLRLHAQGRLNLDQTVTSCSKLDLPPEYGRITLRDLLLNRSGLPREFIVRWEPLDTWTAFSCGFFGTDIYAQRHQLARPSRLCRPGGVAEQLSGTRVIHSVIGRLHELLV